MVSASSVRLIRELSDGSVQISTFSARVPSRQAHHPCRRSRDHLWLRLLERTGRRQRPWLRIQIAEIIVELLSDVARQFEVLAFGPRRPARGSRDRRRMSAAMSAPDSRKVRQTPLCADPCRPCPLELRHAAEPARPRATQLKIQLNGFGMAGNLALVEHDMFLRVDAGSDEGRRHLAGVARMSSAGSAPEPSAPCVIACMSTT